MLERVNGEPAHGKAERQGSMSGSHTVPAGGIESYPDNRPAARFREERFACRSVSETIGSRPVPDQSGTPVRYLPSTSFKAVSAALRNISL